MSGFEYKAFISYSHKDKGIASWLLKKLETYRLPGVGLRRYIARDSQQTHGLGSFFRDRENLSAGDSLEYAIFDALRQSEYLIVVCSPHSATSARVNAEVREFMRTRDGQKILCLIVDGEPGITHTIGGDATRECFSPALLHLMLTHDPLAADARPSGDGRRLALSKLVAGLTSTDLTRLLRREQSRRRTQAAIAAMAFGAVVISLASFGYRANVAEKVANSARVEAEYQAKRAENLAEFMLDEMIANRLIEVGRVDALDVAIEKIVSYYSAMPDGDLPIESLSRKTRAFIHLGRAYLRQDQPQKAKEMYQYALTTSKALVAREPASSSGAHAYMTSLFAWIGYLVRVRDLDQAEEYARRRLDFTEKFMARHAPEYPVLDDYANQHVHLGWVLMLKGEAAKAEELFLQGRDIRRSMMERYPDEDAWPNNLAGAYYHLAWAQSYLGKHQDAVANAQISNKVYKELYLTDDTDQRDRRNLARSYRWLAETLIAAGQYEEAMAAINASLEMFDALVLDDPENENQWYQMCFGAVIQAELTLELNQNYVSPDQSCQQRWGILEPSHFKATHRVLYYRKKIADIEYAVRHKNLAKAASELAVLKPLLEREYQSGEAPYPEIELLQVNVAWLDMRLAHEQAGTKASSKYIAQAQTSDLVKHPRTLQILQKVAAFRGGERSTYMSR